MKPYLIGPLTSLYRSILNVYPPAYRAQFGREMYDTFIEGIEDAGMRGMLGWFVLKELRDAPKALANAYWDGWRTKLNNGIRALLEIAPTSDLPPAPPDGRESWRQAFLELSLFVVAALLLITVTYFDGTHPGWQRDSDSLGKVIMPLTLPFLLLGLARGLPRWAYPFGGLLVGYQVFVSYQFSMWLFLFVMVLAFLMLIVVEVITNPQRSLLPIPLRRIGQSVSMDWTRLSFGMFGAMPLVILLAFDDAHINSRTPYFALSALMMVMCALIYSRSRERALQITTLLAGLTFSICGAWMDKIHFAGGLMDWVTVPSAGIEEMFWLLRLWIQWGLLILSPVLLTLLGRAVNLKRAV